MYVRTEIYYDLYIYQNFHTLQKNWGYDNIEGFLEELNLKSKVKNKWWILVLNYHILSKYLKIFNRIDYYFSTINSRLIQSKNIENIWAK